MNDYEYTSKEYTTKEWITINKDGNPIILIDQSQIVMIEEIKQSYNRVITRIYLNNGLKKDIQVSLKNVIKYMNIKTEN